MADLCHNRLRISGPTVSMDDIKKTMFVQRNGTHEFEFDFNGILPFPEEKDKSSVWVADYWGCSSNALESNMTGIQKRDVLDFGFDTNWSPPFNVIEALVEAYSDCVIAFHYFGADNYFAGSIVSTFGEIVRKHNDFSTDDGKIQVKYIAATYFDYFDGDFD